METKIVHNMTEFLEYTQIITLLKDQMEYIGTPKQIDEIKKTIKIMFTTDHAKLMVLEDRGMLLGFVFFNVAIGLQSGGHYIWINEMHIHRNYRNKGNGSVLFQALVSWAKENNIKRIMGIVDDINPKTKDFYIKQGAEVYKEDILSLKL